MAAPQQFSLRWNNYSQHIVTALDDLRSDDELTDVTLSCDGQRLKAHKILLAACSSFFRDTFKENPCKHPIIIIKGVSFRDLEAVVTFMYNGQVNVSQDRLQTFLAAAELLQIKGLTDVNEKEETAKKRAPSQPSGNLQNHNNSLSHSSRSGTPDLVQRPPSPKRKRVAGDVGNDDLSSVGAFSGVNSIGTLAGSNGGAHTGLNSCADADESFQPKVAIKYEDEQEEEDFDDKGNLSSEDNDSSMQDLLCNVEPGTMGSFLSGSGGAGTVTSGTDSSHGHGGQPMRHRRSLLKLSHLGEGIGPGILAGSTLLEELEIMGIEPGQTLDEDEFIEEDEEEEVMYEDDEEDGQDDLDLAYSGVTTVGPTPTRTISSVAMSRNLDAPYVCEICGKGYVHSCTLVQHRKLHEGQTRCRLCSQILSNVSNLRAHYQTVHGYSNAEVQGKFVFQIKGNKAPLRQ